MKQLPGSITANRLRLVTSSRLRVRFQYCVTSWTYQSRVELGALRVVGLDQRGVALGAEDPGAEVVLVGAQPQDQVVELAGQRHRPPADALVVRVGRRRGLRAADGDVDPAGGPVERRGHPGVA